MEVFHRPAFSFVPYLDVTQIRFQHFLEEDGLVGIFAEAFRSALFPFPASIKN